MVGQCSPKMVRLQPSSCALANRCSRCISSGHASFLVYCIDSKKRVTVAQNGANGPFQSVRGFITKIRRHQVHTLSPQTLLRVFCELAVIATNDLSHAAMSLGA
jgi:hypothetical protein